MKEKWKDIPGFEGRYKASNLGNFKSFLKDKKYGKPHITSKYSNGYLQLSLQKDNKRNTFIAHRVIAMLFIPNPDNKKFVNHKNGKKDDNRAINLEWVTNSENLLHSFRELGRVTRNMQGTNNTRVKLTEKDVLYVRANMFEGTKTMEDLAQEFNVEIPCIWKIHKRYTWKHLKD